MGKFMIATFLLLGWGFYELSGGADFQPEAWPTQVAEAETVVAEPVTAEIVTRSETQPLTLNAAVTQIALENTQAAETPAAAPEATTAAEELIASIGDAAIPASEPTTESVTTEPLDLRAVAGSRVNMREGPGTDYGVIDTLPGGTEAEVIEVNADGWARIRLIGTNQIGWMAERLLTPI